LLDILDVKGELIRRVPFFVSFVDVEGQKREVVPFTLWLPSPRIPVGLVQLKLGEKTLDEISVSDNVPSVAVLSPNGGEKWTGVQEIRWSSRDEDGDLLTFNILYTPDNGQSWIPVTSGVAGSSYQADFSLLPGGNQARIRVIASDGFNTAEDDSDEWFAVLPGPPHVFIDTPQDGITVAEGESIQFSGKASDAEDEQIPETGFIWSYGNTTFASGSSVQAVLPVGEHLVLLSVVDSDGQVGEAVVQVRVSPDTDNDGIADFEDNCILVPNGPLAPDAGGNIQRDTDSDGYGNICDPDFDNQPNPTVDFADLAVMKSVFFTADPDADLDGNRAVDFADLAIMKAMFFGPPGPSGLVP
jgi:hypothetical protein